MDPSNKTPQPIPDIPTLDTSHMPEGQTIDLSSPASSIPPQTSVNPQANPSSLPGVEVSPAPAPASVLGPAELPMGNGAALDEGKRAFYKSRLFFGGLLGLIAAIIAGTSYVVFAVVPNTPQNVWRRGMASVGVGLEEIVVSSFEESNNTNTNFSGKFEITSPTQAELTFDGSYDVAGSGALNFDADIAGENFGLDTIYRLSGEDNLPQVYFKPSGIESLIVAYVGLFTTDDVLNGQQIDDVWWILDYQELADRGLLSVDEINELQNSQDQLGQQDYEDFSMAILDAANEHIFTADESKMIFDRQEDLGEEDYEGVPSEKYRITINKENLASFLKLARDNVDATDIRNKLGIDKPFAEEGLTDEDIDNEIDDMDLDGVVMHAWVAKDSKVLRNVRLSDPENDGNYVDFSLLLDDGIDSEKLPMRILINYDDESYNGYISLTMAMERSNGDITFDLKGDLDGSGFNDEKIEFEMSMLLQGTAESPALEIPADARSFLDLIDTVTSAEPVNTTTEQDTGVFDLEASSTLNLDSLDQIDFSIDALNQLDDSSVDPSQDSTFDFDFDGLNLDASADLDQGLLDLLDLQGSATSEAQLQEAIEQLRLELDRALLDI